MHRKVQGKVRVKPHLDPVVLQYLQVLARMERQGKKVPQVIVWNQ